jgi:hypothetical protein
MPPLPSPIHSGKKYLYSFLSLLCVVGWIVLLVSVLYISENDRWMTNLPIAHALTVAEGIVGGSILILMRVISTKRLKYSFIYNLCGTLNIMVGSITGLIIAEIELTSEDEHFTCPDWIDKEVTGDKKYYNSNLTIAPFKNWPS